MVNYLLLLHYYSSCSLCAAVFLCKCQKIECEETKKGVTKRKKQTHIKINRIVSSLAQWNTKNSDKIVYAHETIKLKKRKIKETKLIIKYD